MKLGGCPFPLTLLKLAAAKRGGTSAKADTNLSSVFVFILSLLQMLKGRCSAGNATRFSYPPVLSFRS